MTACDPGQAENIPLIGRATEVALLTDRWEQAQEGMGQVVLIAGEAGLGKSRLVRTIKEAVSGSASERTLNHSVIEWRCSELFQDTGLYPVADCLARLFDFHNDELPGAQFDRLAEYLEECGLQQPDAVALFARLLFLPADQRFPMPGLTPVREREETFRTLHTWLRAIASREPLLFVVEDLHWMDAPSLEFLRQFTAEGRHDRILTVLTFRSEFTPPWPPPAHQTSLALNRLTRRQVAEVVRSQAGRAIPAAMVAQLYERTGGLPLLVEEFSQMLKEPAGGQAMSAGEGPETLQQLVMARLDRMSSNCEIAQNAALLGREFTYELLAATVRVDEPTLRAELEKLAGADILFSKGQPPRCAYTFKHALVEEALRSSLDEQRRRELHRHVAEILETRFLQVPETPPERLAQHFTEAGEIGKAIKYWALAGQHALSRFANAEAIRHFERGLELLRYGPDSAERHGRELELLGPLGAAYVAAHGYAAPEVGPIFERARLLSPVLGESPEIFVLMRGNFAYHIVRGDFRLCGELAAEALAFAGRIGEPGLLMEALFLQGITNFYRGDFNGARACFEEALQKYDDRSRTASWASRTGEDSGVTHRCYLSLACWHLGEPERALAYSEKACALARTLHHPFSLAYALHHSGWLHQHCRLGAQTQAAGEEEMRIATEQGFLFWHATGTLYAAAGRLLRGRLEEGLPLFQQGLHAYRATGARLGLTYYLGILGEAFMRAGRLDEAGQAFEEALALAGQHDERFHEAELHRLMGEWHLAAGAESVAGDSFGRAIAIARGQQSRAWELRATVSLARLWHRQGRPHEAFAVLAQVLSLFTGGLQMPDLAGAASLLEELGNKRMRDDLAAGVKYVLDCIPPPMRGPIAVNWRYLPSSTLGGDTLGYHWVDEQHLALYLLDVTGHGLDSALLAVTITNVIRSGSLAGADLREPDQVLAALNRAFQGSRHGSKYFTLWYGVYRTPDRVLSYASGGHPPAIVVLPGGEYPMLLPATGPIMGVLPKTSFPVSTAILPPGSRLYVVSDGVFEIRRDRQPVWDLPACVERLTRLVRGEEEVLSSLLAYARELRGSPQLDDDFSILEVVFT